MPIFKDYADVITVKELCEMLKIGKNTAYGFTPFPAFITDYAQRLAKKVMQIVDHCTIYLLIGGTYTLLPYAPFVLSSLFGAGSCLVYGDAPRWAPSLLT